MTRVLCGCISTRESFADLDNEIFPGFQLGTLGVFMKGEQKQALLVEVWEVPAA